MHPCIKLLIRFCSCVVCARANLSNRCIIQMASARSKLAVWGYLAIGLWLITKTELDEADHKFESIHSEESPSGQRPAAVSWFDKILLLIKKYFKIFERMFERIINAQQSDNRLMMLQDVSSIFMFPSYFIMCSSHVFYEAFCSPRSNTLSLYLEYISSIVLTGLLLLRLMIYMLGIERAAENLLLLYESRKDFMFVIVFYLVPHFSVSLALALKDRYRRDTAMDNVHFGTDNSSSTVNQSTTHGSKIQATNGLATSLSMLLEAILDPSFGGTGVQDSPGEMNWEDIVLAVVRVIGMTIVPFALHNIILATMMNKRGEQYQAHATAMWKLARSMIIMSIDQEIIATRKDGRLKWGVGDEVVVGEEFAVKDRWGKKKKLAKDTEGTVLEFNAEGAAKIAFRETGLLHIYERVIKWIFPDDLWVPKDQFYRLFPLPTQEPYFEYQDKDDAWLANLTLKYKVGSASYMEYMGVPTQVNEYLCVCLSALVSLRQLAAHSAYTSNCLLRVYMIHTHQPQTYAQTPTRR
jgi:hypothetical protein